MKEKGKEGKEVRSEEGKGWVEGAGEIQASCCNGNNGQISEEASVQRGRDPERQTFDISLTLKMI